MSVQIYDSSESDTSPLSTDEYDDDDDSDLMDMAVSVKSGPSSSSNNKATPSKDNNKDRIASSSSLHIKSSAKSSLHGRAAVSRKKNPAIQPPRFNAISKKRCLKWFKGNNRRAALRLCLNEFYLIRNKIQKNGDSMVVAAIKPIKSTADEEEKLKKFNAKEEVKYDQQQIFLEQQQKHQRSNTIDQIALNDQPKQQQPQQNEKEERPLVGILKHHHQQEQQRLENKSPALICVDVTEDEDSPQKSEPPKINNHFMQIKIVDIKSSADDDVVICPDDDDDEEDNVNHLEINKINYEKTSDLQTPDVHAYGHDNAPLLNYRPTAESQELKNVSSSEVIKDTNNHSAAQFLVNASALSHTLIPGILEDIAAVNSITIENDDDDIQMQVETSEVVDTTPSTTIEVLSDQQQQQQQSEQQQQQQLQQQRTQHQQMVFKATSTPTPTLSSSLCNMSANAPQPPQVVTPMAHTPSPIRAPQTTATPQAAHMRSPIVPSTHTSSVVTSSTPITTSATLPPPQIHASNMSVKRRRSISPENMKSPAEKPQQETATTSKQRKESTNLPKDAATGNDDCDQQQSKKIQLDPTTNAAFYEKIIDFIPIYEEAMATHLQKTKEGGIDALYEAIKCRTNDLIVLEKVLKIKEEEWNKLLYLKRVQQELIERMLRLCKALKAIKRGEMVDKYTIKQIRELEVAFKISLAVPDLSPETVEEPEPERDNQTSQSVQQMAEMINRLENMRPEDLQEQIRNVRNLKDQLSFDKPQERLNNNIEAKNRLFAESISKQEESKRQREEERLLKSMEAKIQEEQRLRHEHHLLLEKQLELERLRELHERFGKYEGGVRVPVDHVINKAKEELNSRHQPVTAIPVALRAHYRCESPESLPPPPLYKYSKPPKPESYVSNSSMSNNNYAHNYKATPKPPFDNIPRLKTLNDTGASCSSGRGGSDVNYMHSKRGAHNYEHSGPSMSTSNTNPYRSNYDIRFNNDSYDESLRTSTTNPYKNPNRHSYSEFEYSRNNSFGTTNGSHLDGQKCNVCQLCFKNEALFACSNCNVARYCSRKCQLTAWEKHEKVCGY